MANSSIVVLLNVHALSDLQGPPAKSINCCVVLPLTEVAVLIFSCGVQQYIRLLKKLRLLCTGFVEPGLLICDLVGHADHCLSL